MKTSTLRSNINSLNKMNRTIYIISFISLERVWEILKGILLFYSCQFSLLFCRFHKEDKKGTV